MKGFFTKEGNNDKVFKLDFTLFILFLLVFTIVLFSVAIINLLLGSEEFGVGLLIGSCGIFIPGIYMILKFYLGQRSYIKQLSDVENIDKLTGLINFTFFRSSLKKILKENEIRKNNNLLGVMTIGIDKLKFINNALGYEIGDEIIVKVKDKIVDTLGRDNFISRQGNIFLVYSYESDISLKVKLEKLLEQLQSLPISPTENDISVSVSIGFAFCDESYIKDEDVLLKKSEIARDYAKRNGGNQYLIYNDKMESKSLDDLFLENELKVALVRNELSVHYQPKIDTKSNKVIGAEALIRWKNPLRGNISPDKFIAIAENIGMINAIGEFVIERSCEQIKRWENLGFDDLTVSINVSAKQFKHYDLLSVIRENISKYGISPHKLEIEITESLLIEDKESTLKILKDIKSCGIKISVDDFGTKYCSLQYLKDYPVNTLKIDRNFINGMLNNKHDSAIVSTVVLLANRIGYSVIAEGVENKEQLEALKNEGCYLIQGYYFSKPLTEDEFIDYIKKFEI